MRTCHLRFQLQNSDLNDPVIINSKTINNFHGRFHWHLNVVKTGSRALQLHTGQQSLGSTFRLSSHLKSKMTLNDPVLSRATPRTLGNIRPTKRRAGKDARYTWWNGGLCDCVPQRDPLFPVVLSRARARGAFTFDHIMSGNVGQERLRNHISPYEATLNTRPGVIQRTDD